ncbi:MsnO8 family LLM class oxidoreductase [Alkalicoccobacillus gibsonii]|jgi:luciferase family oxidoreductase group 1|uniref:MsnO8 family LLM class oxidoreductase n=1 Tax=Alkalicoccobacillus gibsonii TaxID=79881 RepID=UPI0035191B17
MRISILDQSPIAENENATDALLKTVQLAQFADENGFHRFWVSEHHNFAELAGSAPEALIPYLLAKTERIRVGSGGVMLQHYPAFKVAEVFNVLASLEPGRVDLGIGKAPGGTTLSTKALQGHTTQQLNFDEKLEELLHFVSDGETVEGLIARPTPPLPADVYLLGGSVKSAELAATKGISYVFASFINSNREELLEAASAYRRLFTHRTKKPELLVAMGIIVGDTDDEAKQLNKYPYSYKVHVDDGRALNMNSYERAVAFGESTGMNYWIDKKESGVIAGSIQTVEQELEKRLAGLEIDELIIHSPITDFDKRINTLRQLKNLSVFQTESIV